jgi:acyl-CoA synthetase (AMP-forming)/AMP-acid ligase II
MPALLTFGEALAVNARLFPDHVGASDLERAMSFRAWNARACRLANALLGLGLRKGDRVAVLAYNCIEWLEIYAAAAKAGLIMVPINFRLVAPEIAYVVADSGAAAMIVQDALRGVIEEMGPSLSLRPGQSARCISARARHRRGGMATRR